MIIGQVLDKFLPITEPWIYNQITSLEKHGVNSKIFCHKITNQDSFQHKHVFSYKNLPSWKINAYKLKSLAVKQDAATLYWNNIIKREKVDIIHSHFGWAAFKGIDLAIKNNIPHIVTFYGADVFRDPFDPNKTEYQKKLPLIFEKSEKIICVSNILKNDLVKLGADKSKIIVWRPGVDVLNKNRYFKQKNDNVFKIISTGRFIGWKGQKYLIKAIPQIIKKHPNIEVVFIGTGDTLENCKKLAIKLNVDSKIKFSGKLPDHNNVLSEIATSDVLIHSSFVAKNKTCDSLGMVIMEAAIHGVPAIASNSGGIPEIINDGKTGLLVNEKNSQDIAEKISRLIEDKNLLNSLGENAQKFAVKNFDKENQIKELLKIIQ